MVSIPIGINIVRCDIVQDRVCTLAACTMRAVKSVDLGSVEHLLVTWAYGSLEEVVSASWQGHIGSAPTWKLHF